MAGGTMIVRFLFDQVAPEIGKFANDGSAAMIGYIGPVAVSLLTIYVLLWGMAMATGQISEPFTDGMKRILRMVLIISLALTAGIYQSFFVDFFTNAPGEIANAVGGTVYENSYSSDRNSMAATLDNNLDSGFKIAGKAWDRAVELQSGRRYTLSFEALIYGFLSIFFIIISLIVVGAAAGIIFVAWIAMAILLAIGPIFILMAIFPATQRWFEAWLGQTVNYMLTFVLVALVCTLVFKVLAAYFDQIIAWHTDIFEVMVMVMKAVGMTIAAIAVILQMSSIAGALAGGAGIQSAQIAGKLAAMGTGVAGGAAWMLNKHRTAGESANDPARSNLRRIAGSPLAAGRGVKKGYERARQVFRSNTAKEG